MSCMLTLTCPPTSAGLTEGLLHKLIPSMSYTRRSTVKGRLVQSICIPHEVYKARGLLFRDLHAYS